MIKEQPSPARIARIEKILRDDIWWAVAYGPGFDGRRPASYHKDGTWIPPDPLVNFLIEPQRPRCGVCALGAWCLRRQPLVDPTALVQDSNAPDIHTACTVFGMSFDWMETVWRVVGFPKDINGPQSARALAQRLRAYGDDLQARAPEIRDEAAQAEQLEAERRGWA